ncbi:MAG: amino acid adenylation domain-containing protein, partial [Candidatus Aminicenantes bacterium]
MNRERNFSRKTAIAAVQYGKEGEYWLKKFSGDLQKTSFPYDYPKSKPQMDGEKKDVVKFEFTSPAVSKLLELSKGLEHRLYIILAANLVVLLHKYTGNKDIIIGSPILKQEREGDFINTTLALRNQLDEDITFKELLLDRVRPTITEANQHQNYPIETLLFQLNMTAHQGDFPLFDVVILLENIHEKKYIQHTNPNIIFSFLLIEGSIKGTLEYNPLLYQRTSAEKLANRFKRLMEQVVFNIDIPISQVEILSTEEKRQLLVEFNNTRTNYPAEKTIDELFAEQSAQTPNHIALTYESEPKTYKQLNEEASKLASYLRFLGVTREEPVALMVENSYRVIVAILGILKAGGAYLPINIDYPDQRKKYIINDCCVKRILTNIEVGKLHPGITLIHLEHTVTYQYPSPSAAGSNKKCRADNLAYIMYTSGSTGTPKGVMVNHRNVVRLVKNTNYIKFEKGDSILLTGALEFDASTFEIWGALLNGLTLHLVNKETLLNHYQLKQAIIKNGVTTMWMTSPLYNQVLDADIEIFTGLKNLLVGGDVLSPYHINRLKARFPGINVINGYGPTENTTFSVTHLIDREYKENIPIGKPISNSTTYILDKHLHLVPIGICGDLFVGGDGVSRGYLNNQERSMEKFIADPFSPERDTNGRRLYATGDLARWLTDGKIEFLGRRDHQVKIRGYRIEPGEIENHLVKIEGIHDVVVIDGKNKDGDKYLCAYI